MSALHATDTSVNLEMKAVPCEFLAKGLALLGCAARPSQSRRPTADVDVDEVDVKGKSCCLHGISDRAIQQADTCTDRNGHRDQSSETN